MSDQEKNIKNIIIPKQVEQVMNILEKQNYDVYVVGGMVRDQCLGVDSQDWDLTTNALPETLKKLFPYAILVGIQYGTIALKIEGIDIQITTFRTEGTYLQHRKPKEVTFVRQIEEDLSRRDFTVNAIAYHPIKGWRDPFQGREDIEKKIIRCVGNPKDRFREDAIRMIRALRFAIKDDFQIEEKTWHAIQELADLISKIPPMRLQKEMTDLLSSNALERAFTLLIESGIWKGLFQNSKNDLQYVIQQELIEKLTFENKKQKLELVLLLIMEHEAISEEQIRIIFQTYGSDKTMREHIIAVLKYVNHNTNEVTFENVVNACMTLKEAFSLYGYWLCYHNMESQVLLQSWLETIKIKKSETMMIKGDTLKSLGMLEGKEMGFMLTYLRKEYLLGNIQNNSISLRQKVKQEIDKKI